MARSFKPFFHQAYYDEGAGPVVVILHGPFGNLKMWRSTIVGMKDDFRIVIPRLPLFSSPVSEVTVKDLSDVLLEFLDWHQLTDVTLIGHGVGGQVALRHAYDHPDRVENVIITGTSNALLYDSSEDVANDIDAIGALVKKAFYNEKKVTAGVVESVFESLKGQALDVGTHPSQENNINHLLVHIKQPVLLAWGLHDKITPPEIAVHFNDHLPNGELRFIPRSGHLPMIEESEQFLSAVKDFLKSA